MQSEFKRLFFGIEVHAPWPSDLPRGRLLDENHRHITLAFLGNIPFLPLQEKLSSFPKILQNIGSAGYFDRCLALPPRHPHVIAWHVQWLEQNSMVQRSQIILSDWLVSQGYALDQRPWMPHVTLCRKPFDEEEWMNAFSPLPCYTGAIHLFESVGSLNYIPIWSYPLRAPFEEVDHTADLAFIVRGDNFENLFLNAFTALAFKAPDLLKYFHLPKPFNHLDDIIIALNEILSRMDSIAGCPMKAVSFHGEAIQLEKALIQWEMIVDV